jgi:hypothetical protein
LISTDEETGAEARKQKSVRSKENKKVLTHYSEKISITTDQELKKIKSKEMQ